MGFPSVVCTEVERHPLCNQVDEYNCRNIFSSSGHYETMCANFAIIRQRHEWLPFEWYSYYTVRLNYFHYNVIRGFRGFSKYHRQISGTTEVAFIGMN